MIEIRTPEEIDKIRLAGLITKNVLIVLCKNSFPGRSTLELDKIAYDVIVNSGAIPAFKGYRGYPASICTSINDSIVHEIPSDKRIIKHSDIVSYDVGVRYKDYCADAAITIGIGEISSLAVKLIDVTRKALSLGIEKAEEGNRVSDISYAVQSYVEENGFSVVRQFVGHGIGRAIHEEPEIPNFGSPNKGPRIRQGMIFAIEPMVNAGGSEAKILNNGWTAVTADGSLSAHFEHTICVKQGKAEILTA